MLSGFKRKASEEAASPDSGSQIIKKARTDSPVKEVRTLEALRYRYRHVAISPYCLSAIVLISTPHRKMALSKGLRFALFHSLRRYLPTPRHGLSCLFARNIG